MTTCGNAAEADKSVPLERMIERLDADFFVFSGALEYQNVERFLDMAEKGDRRKNAALILTTFGGDAAAAYRLARFLKAHYSKFYLYVFGFCKSAGTLLALGADEIVMTVRGEFGPLDVQLVKADEFTEISSGMDISTGLDEVGRTAFQMFEQHLLNLKQRSGGAITTKTAAQIASSVVVGLLSPVTEQIDPFRLGETRRAMKIAHQYGTQLGAGEKVLKHLTEDYPSHDFVIDYAEAKDLFRCVRLADQEEVLFESNLRRSLQHKVAGECLRLPGTPAVVGPLKPQKRKGPEGENTKSIENDNVNSSGTDCAQAEAGGSNGALGGDRTPSPDQRTAQESAPASETEAPAKADN